MIITSDLDFHQFGLVSHSSSISDIFYGPCILFTDVALLSGRSRFFVSDQALAPLYAGNLHTAGSSRIFTTSIGLDRNHRCPVCSDHLLSSIHHCITPIDTFIPLLLLQMLSSIFHALHCVPTACRQRVCLSL
jgi:hypothetical protein